MWRRGRTRTSAHTDSETAAGVGARGLVVTAIRANGENMKILLLAALLGGVTMLADKCSGNTVTGKVPAIVDMFR